MSTQAVVEALLEYRERNYQSDLIYSLPKEVSDLVSTNSFAFLVAVAFDRGMPWQKAWAIPYHISRRGMLDPYRLAQMGNSELRYLLERLPYLPRYGSTEGARTLSDCAKLTLEFGGDAALIWRDVSPREAERRLQRIRGVGPGIASMTTRILRDDFGAFRGREYQIDVKPDVHVMRVFKRAGLTGRESEAEAVSVARRLHPDFPGALDWPAWIIGQNWCVAGSPNCAACTIAAVCPKRI